MHWSWWLQGVRETHLIILWIIEKQASKRPKCHGNKRFFFRLWFLLSPLQTITFLCPPENVFIRIKRELVIKMGKFFSWQKFFPQVNINNFPFSFSTSETKSSNGRFSFSNKNCSKITLLKIQQILHVKTIALSMAIPFPHFWLSFCHVRKIFHSLSKVRRPYYQVR